MNNMTAKVSCFARAYHYKNNSEWIFKDDIAEVILGEEDYLAIADNMAKGIEFFAPGFKGTDEEALRFIVDHQLAPSVLGRSSFCEKHLMNEIRLGCSQYVLFASGYDTFAFRNKEQGLRVFELDLPEMITDKERRAAEGGLSYPQNTVLVPCDLADESWAELLTGKGFDKNCKSFGSLLGISYYLLKQDFRKLISRLSDLFSSGSAVCFDYPSEIDGVESAKNRQLADAAKEQMKAKYGYSEMEELLADYGFLIYEHLNDVEMAEHFFSKYNAATPEHIMAAPQGVCYLMAVKR